MNKAQELIAWFDENSNQETDIWDLDSLDFTIDEVISRNITGQSRWETFRESVWKFEDGSFARLSWAEGSTEYQENYPNMTIEEVEPYESVEIKYRKIMAR